MADAPRSVIELDTRFPTLVLPDEPEADEDGEAA
jgi:hypothetical protein